MTAVTVFDKNYSLTKSKTSAKQPNVNDGDYSVGMHMIFFMLLINFIFSVGIVFANKKLYQTYKFPPVTLACVHFAVTFMGLGVCVLAGELKIKLVPIYKILPISLAFCSFVVFTNLSLKHNSIGTYQILKCLGDPLLITLQCCFYNKSYSIKIKSTLVVMVVGIVVNSLFDVGYNGTGIFFGLVAVVGATLYYLWIETKQSELELKPMQLLFLQAPTSSLLLAIVVIFTNNPWKPHGIFTTINSEGLFLMLVSSTMACAVNVSVFFIIRHTSVITYAVFSKVKTCVVILGGSLIAISPQVLKANQLIGICLTLLGTALYTVFKLAEFDESHRSSRFLPRFSGLQTNKENDKITDKKLKKVLMV